jgi:F0F1-type ATP synthase delta subunit
VISISRRRLARYGADELLAGKSPRQVAKQLAAVMILTKREKQTDLLVADIAWELEARGKMATATVTTASPLTDSLRREIVNFITKSAQVNNATLEERVDKSVLGGVRIETEAHSWDKTARRRLMDIREAF